VGSDNNKDNYFVNYGLGVMMLNATFNNISVILSGQLFGGGNRSIRGKPPTGIRTHNVSGDRH
jgi:hypothetical protein